MDSFYNKKGELIYLTFHERKVKQRWLYKAVDSDNSIFYQTDDYNRTKCYTPEGNVGYGYSIQEAYDTAHKTSGQTAARDKRNI